jgi:hypothetical protein
MSVGSPGAKGGRHGDRIVGGRGGCVLRTLRLGHRDGGAPVEGARRSATEALSENPSGRCETDAVTQDLCRVLPLSCDAHVAPAHPPPWGDSRDHSARADCSDRAQMVHTSREVTRHQVATPSSARGHGSPGSASTPGHWRTGSERRTASGDRTPDRLRGGPDAAWTTTKRH